MSKAQKIYVGGWFQRTTLHLSEIYDFLESAASPLELDKEKLKALRNAMDIATVRMEVSRLDWIDVKSKTGVEIKIYEDGLVVLSKENTNTLSEDIKALTSYYEEKLSPGISYIFSLGAPIPKELANIKTIYPYFVVLKKAAQKDIKEIFAAFNEKEYFDVRKKEFEIYRGDKLYVINNISESMENVECFINEQIFIREFKAQLHRYLNLHRIIWERIAEVKEKGSIRGKEVGAFKEKIESYAKTINLIEARINQMGTYLKTRGTIIKDNRDLEKFLGVLEFKHETLADTLEYIKDIWGMTKNYVQSALDLFGSIQAKSTESSVKNLAIITSMGVGATLISLFTQKPPSFTMVGALYFLILAAIGYATDKTMKTIYSRRMYAIRDAKVAKDIA
ncbi:MAG: hypothetical protein ABSC29_00995 [Minisyncoccia bacterium]